MPSRPARWIKPGKLVVLHLLAGLLLSQGRPAQAAPRRIIDDADTVVLKGNVHPLARSENDEGMSDLSLPMEHVSLVLKVGSDKRAALERLLSEQQDPSSPQYHRWLTPEQFGTRFGRAQDEIALVSDWLRSQGFTIDDVPSNRTWINFSGTAAEVNRAFHTEIHDYRVDGKVRHANATEPSLPRALSGVVEGVLSLNNFPVPYDHHAIPGELAKLTAGGEHYLAPGDLTTIYDLPSTYTGAGQSIAIAARSNILLSDVQTFRSTFSLPPRDPQITVNGTDPGSFNHGDEMEADLDTEWAGAVAPDATIKLVVSASTNTTDGVVLSAQYIVSHDLAPVVSVSFSPCEQLMSPAYQSSMNMLWAEAAAQGITVVASAGDWGAAGCSYYNPSNPADNPYRYNQAVSGFCSTPFNVCVGGTQFNEGTDPSFYWSAQGAALRYIPEDAWNEASIGATGGGPSNVYLSKPSWQAGLGVPADGRRDVPDLSFSAALHDGYEIVQEFATEYVGGTSASAPAFAGVMARIIQRTGQRQGNPNPVLYQLAAAQASGGAGRVFHDVLRGDNTFSSVTGFHCTSGYDLSTGLGSVDATVLIDNWPALGAMLTANPPSGIAPCPTALTAQATGEGYGTLNYTFWWHCPFAVSSVAQGIQQCGDPANSAIGMKFGTVSELSETVAHTYPSAQTYKPLVIVERNNGAVAATASVSVSASPTCTSFTPSPASANPSAAAGSQQVAIVGSPAGCQGGAWTASGNGSWLTVAPSSGSGSGSVTVSWTANGSTTSRSGNATLAGTAFLVTQAGTVAAPAAPFLLSPGAAVYPGTTTNVLSPWFFWQTVAGADSYQLELSDGATVYPVQTLSASQTSTLLPFSLADNHAYKWHMRSHGAAGYGVYGGYYYFSTYTGSSTGDFTLVSSSDTAGVTPGASASFVLETTTLQGTPQTLTFSAGNVPAGVSASFSPPSIQSGNLTTLTLAVGSGAAPGSYTITVSATSNVNVTHSVTIGLQVNPLPGTGEPAVCLTPSSLGFSDQMVGTSSVTQLVTLRNCGNGPLHVSSIGASPDYFLGAGSIVPPVDLPEGTATTFQVGFAPLASGPRPGSVKIFSNAAGSPTILALSGNATPAPVTTGTINVAATLNGQPFTGYMPFSLTGPGGTINFGNVPFSRPDQAAGSYTVGFLGSAPGGGTLDSISPAATQTLTAGGAVLFTFNFTAPNEFGFLCPTATYTGTTALFALPPGGSASIPLRALYGRGGTETITLDVAGLPAGSTGTFDPQPVVLAEPGTASTDFTFNVTTGASTQPGLYQLTFTATNQDGTAHSLTGTLMVVTDPGLQLVSSGVGGTQANGFSDLPAVSADGRYVAFGSFASNLVAGDTNGAGDVFVRDRQTGTTARVSVADDGAQSDDLSNSPSISADGRYAAFYSVAGDLIPGGRRGFGDIYVRDRQLGRTLQVNLSSAGVPADAGSFYPSISGDGRYVAFNSAAANLVPGGGGGVPQVYVRDLQMGTTTLVSAADDGLPGDGGSTNPVISGDGRYVAFYSTASNFVSGATAAGRQVFLHDRQTGTTQLVSGGPDGAAPNGLAYLDSEERLAISPDGRYVAFSSYASNLVPGDDNSGSDIFVWDRTTKETRIASLTNDGALLFGAYAPAISADGRFVAFRFFVEDAPAYQIGVRDMLTQRTLIYSLGPGGVLGSSSSVDSALSSDGRVLVFASGAPNLIVGDTNGQQDVFSVALPTLGTPFAQTLSVAPASVPGGGTATGTVTLSGPAPAGGASVSLASSDLAAQVPSVVTVPAGGSSASFPIPTLPVSAEFPVSLTASYGGGSPWTSLLLEKAAPARIDVLQGDGQGVVVGSLLQTPLKVRVLDSANNPAVNVAVQFSVPMTGPSGSFSGGVSSVLIVTDASGVATAPPFTANGVLGQYAVIASAAGITSPAVFSLTNVGNAIFSNGFESGTLAGWQSTPP